jgi:putative redox protein
MDTHNISTFFGSGMAASSTIGDYKVVTDTTADNGGTDTGPGPKRLMLASLAGCTGIDIVSILNKMKVPFSDLSIDTQATLTDTHPKTYDWVKLTYKIRLAEGDRIKMEKAVKLSEDKYCGVMAMFKTFARLEKEIVWL